MRRTKHDLPEAIRSANVELLNARLADAVDLMMQAKQAHWTVRGPAFIAQHELFDKVHESARAHADLLAERVSQLGGLAEGTVRHAAKRSTLPHYPESISASQEHVDALSSALAAFAATVRTAIDTTAERGDAGTADVFTEISRDTDLMLWFVEAHLDAD